MSLSKTQVISDIVSSALIRERVPWWKRIFGKPRIWAYEVCGQVVFPYYSSSGYIDCESVVILIKDFPEALNGGSFGSDEEIHTDKGGSWCMVKFSTYGNMVESIEKFFSAISKLKSA